MKEKRYDLDYLKAFAIILVILGHCFTFYNKNYRAFGTLGRTVQILIYSVHVPTFFVVSGYLCHPQKFCGYCKKKFFRVFLPLFFFTALKIVYGQLFSGTFSHAGDLSQQVKEAYVMGGLYWFAYAICWCYLLAPLFWKAERKGTKYLAGWFLVFFLLDMTVYLFQIRLPH